MKHNPLFTADLAVQDRPGPDATQRRSWKDRARALKKSYGIDEETYLAWRELQGGKCAVCGRKPKGLHGLQVDHNHSTGKIRALLCRSCNLALGMADEDSARLRALAAYLEKHDSPDK